MPDHQGTFAIEISEAALERDGLFEAAFQDALQLPGLQRLAGYLQAQPLACADLQGAQLDSRAELQESGIAALQAVQERLAVQVIAR
ncbi:hypothetical protein K2E96_29700 [Pseudomonas sp. ERGC3:05]|nr:hypothetical protein K2E96_29700 [Pseudomonas sp. ERGC3:05]